MSTFTPGVGGIPVSTITNVAVSGTSYTVLPTDWSKQIETSNSSAVTITIDATSLVGIKPGSIVLVTQAGTGNVVFTGVGVTIRNAPALFQYGTGGLQLKANGEVWGI